MIKGTAQKYQILFDKEMGLARSADYEVQLMGYSVDDVINAKNRGEQTTFTRLEIKQYLELNKLKPVDDDEIDWFIKVFGNPVYGEE